MISLALLLAASLSTWRYLTVARRLKLLQSSRLEFLARLSHELGTPLAAISGRVHGLQDNVFPPETRGQHLAKLSHETAEVSQKMKRLLELSRWEGGAPELSHTEFPLLEPVMDAVEAVEEAFLAQGVDLDFEGLDVYVKGDRGRVRDLIQILLENALAPQARVSITVDRQKERAAIAITDTGNDNELGLDIARRLARAHGGTLELSGSRARFTLPLAKETSCAA